MADNTVGGGNRLLYSIIGVLGGVVAVGSVVIHPCLHRRYRLDAKAAAEVRAEHKVALDKSKAPPIGLARQSSPDRRMRCLPRSRRPTDWKPAASNIESVPVHAKAAGIDFPNLPGRTG